jgi:hypothetical protein
MPWTSRVGLGEPGPATAADNPEALDQRPYFQTRDRLFWMALTHIWPNWRMTLRLVQPDTSCGGIAIGFAIDGLDDRTSARRPSTDQWESRKRKPTIAFWSRIETLIKTTAGPGAHGVNIEPCAHSPSIQTWDTTGQNRR